MFLLLLDENRRNFLALDQGRGSPAGWMNTAAKQCSNTNSRYGVDWGGFLLQLEPIERHHYHIEARSKPFVGNPSNPGTGSTTVMADAALPDPSLLERCRITARAPVLTDRQRKKTFYGFLESHQLTMDVVSGFKSCWPRQSAGHNGDSPLGGNLTAEQTGYHPLNPQHPYPEETSGEA